MVDLEREAQRARDAAAADERQVGAAILAAWRELWARLRPLVDALARAIGAHAQPTRAWVLRLPEYRALNAALTREITAFVALVAAALGAGVARALVAGPRDALRLVEVALGTPPAGRPPPLLRSVPPTALDVLRGRLEAGQPLRELLDELGPQTSQAVRRALLDGIQRGSTPRELAREIRQAANLAPVRAARIARQEILSAYRESARQAYLANDRVVIGWRWVAQLSHRTCPVCWALHGSIHPLEEPFASHVSCRCIPAPVLRDWLAAEAPEIERGPAVFADLPAEQQRRILGPGKYMAYRSGDLTLDDLVQETRHRRWGRGRRERSLRDVLASRQSAAD